MFTTKITVPNFTRTLVAAASLLASSVLAADESNPFIGRWGLTIPGGGAGWLGVTHENGFYDASILWGGGSVLPVASGFFTDGDQRLCVSRINEVRRTDADGKVVRT